MDNKMVPYARRALLQSRFTSSLREWAKALDATPDCCSSEVIGEDNLDASKICSAVFHDVHAAHHENVRELDLQVAYLNATLENSIDAVP